MPCHADALNERSSIPPVSVTMQPRNLPVVEAEPELEDADEDELALELEPDEAELWLLPHPAMTTVADTASATVAHALRFTLTSTGPARRCAWPLHPSWVVPQVMPRDVPTERETRLPGLLVAESEPDHDGSTGPPDRQQGFTSRSLVFSYSPGSQVHKVLLWKGHGRRGTRRRRWRREVQDDGQPAARRLGQRGRAAVGGDQPVHDGQAEPGSVRAGRGEAQERALPVGGAHTRPVVAHHDLRAGR